MEILFVNNALNGEKKEKVISWKRGERERLQKELIPQYSVT